jgi:hypothetical protein
MTDTPSRIVDSHQNKSSINSATGTPTEVSTTNGNDRNMNHIITERYLLAKAKDERYVQYFTKILLSIMEQVPRRLTNFRNGQLTTNHRDDNKLNTITAEFITWVLYILLCTSTTVSKNSYTHQDGVSTPGMNICQIQCKIDDKRNDLQKANHTTIMLRYLLLISPLISMKFIWYIIQYWSYKIQSKHRSLSMEYNYNHLSGQSRRDVFDRQRQEMLRRSSTVTEPIDVLTTTLARKNETSVSPLSTSSGVGNILSKIKKKIQSFYETTIVSIESAIHSLPLDGPHYTTFTRPNPTTPEIESLSNPVLIHVIQWILQFYMAFYYLNGTYPTLLYRLFQYRPRLKTNNTSTTTIPYSTTGNKIIPLVGMLILTQLTWKLLLHGISRPILHYLLTRQQTFSRYASTSWNVLMNFMLQQKQQDHNVTNIDDNEINCIYIEGISPILSAIPSNMKQMGENDEFTCLGSKTNSFICGICRNSSSSPSSKSNASILYPSYSIQCGHVFCWYCIQQWITYYDTKCPICRTICKPNDIQLLYHC